MIRIIGNEKERALRFALARWSLPEASWESFSALILEKSGDIAAAVLYKEYIPANSVEMHVAAVAGGRWLTRSFLRAAFHFPFVQLGVRRVTLLVAADNLPSRRFAEHLGFIPEGRHREGWSAHVDLLSYGMLKRECRFIGEPSGQATRRPASRPDCHSASANGHECRDGGRERAA